MAQAARSKKTQQPASKARARTSRAAGATKPAPRVRADKLSISLNVDDVAWLTRRAKRLGTSVSSVIAFAVADQRRAEARDALLAQLGDDDISEAQVAAARREAFGA